MNHIASFKKILIILMVLVLCGGVAYYALFIHIQSINRTISDLTHQLNVENKKQQNAVVAQLTVNQANPDITLVNNSIIARDGDVGFIESLESMARARNLDITIDSLSLENNSLLAQAGMDVLNVRIKLKGSWLSMYLFMQEIESLNQDIHLKMADISTSETDQGVAKKSSESKQWDGLFEIRVLKYK